MKKLIILNLCGILILLAACGGAPKMSVNFKSKQAEFEAKSALLRVTNEDRILTIANYELKEDDSFSNNAPKAAEQYKLLVPMYDLGDNATDKIEASEYTDDLNSSGNTKTIAAVTLYYFAGGKMQFENMKHYDDGKKRGVVKFTEVKDGFVSGNLEIKDDEGRSVQGSFKAKIIKN